MGFLDDIFDTKVSDSKKTKINYTSLKASDFIPKSKNKKVELSKDKASNKDKLKACVDWTYINSVKWCVAMKGTHIHRKCMREIFDNLDKAKGLMYCEYIETLAPEWEDYWYDGKNQKHYTKQQLKKIEKEFDNGRDSEELVYEMLTYVWFSMIPKSKLQEEIDDVGIYKLRIKWLK